MKLFTKFYTSIYGRVFFTILEIILYFLYKNSLLDINKGSFRWAHFKPSKRILHYLNHQNYKKAKKKYKNEKSQIKKKILDLHTKGYTKFSSLKKNDIENGKKYFLKHPVYNAHKKVADFLIC